MANEETMAYLRAARIVRIWNKHSTYLCLQARGSQAEGGRDNQRSANLWLSRAPDAEKWLGGSGAYGGVGRLGARAAGVL